MLYLFSEQIGVDAAALGFPSVETCLAVVLQTDQVLAGWHSFNTSDTVTASNAQKFGAYLAANAPGTWLRLYGATNRKGHGKNWKSEMRDIANAIGFTGTVIGLDMGVTGEGVHVEFHRNGNARCDIYHKRNSKMDYTQTKTPLATIPHRRIINSAATDQPLYSSDGSPSIFTGATINANSKKGKFHHSSWMDLQSFTV